MQMNEYIDSYFCHWLMSVVTIFLSLICHGVLELELWFPSFGMEPADLSLVT
jgi:hypothetical protein